MVICLSERVDGDEGSELLAVDEASYQNEVPPPMERIRSVASLVARRSALPLAAVGLLSGSWMLLASSSSLGRHRSSSPQSQSGLTVRADLVGMDEVHLGNREGVVHIKSVDGQCLDAGGAIHLWVCDDTKLDQQWIHNRSTGLLRTRKGACLDAGGQLHIWPCDEKNTNQLWSVDPATGFVQANGKDCLDGRDRVHVENCDTSLAKQRWEFKVLPHVDPMVNAIVVDVPEAERSIQIRTTHGKCLDSGGEHVHIWDCDSSNKNQNWQRLQSPGILRSVSGGCLDAGGMLAIRPCDMSNTNQIWTLNTEDNSVKMAGQYCLDYGGNTHVWQCSHQNPNQIWKFTVVVAVTVHPDAGSATNVPSPAPSPVQTAVDQATTEDQCGGSCWIQGEVESCRNYIARFAAPNDCSEATQYVKSRCKICKTCRTNAQGCPLGNGDPMA